VVLFMTAVLAVGPTTEFFADIGTALAAGCVIIGLGVTLAVRIDRIAIVSSPGRITIRGVWASRSGAASEIVRFEPPRAYGALRRTGLRVVLTSGRVLSADAFSKGPLDDDAVGVAEAAELNQWLAAQPSTITWSCRA
jgi:hypothetical protein